MKPGIGTYDRFKKMFDAVLQESRPVKSST